MGAEFKRPSETAKKNAATCVVILLRLFPMRFDFELQISIFRSQKRMTLLRQSKYAKSDRIFFRFENPMTQVVVFWPKIRRPGSSDFQIEKGHAL